MSTPITAVAIVDRKKVGNAALAVVLRVNNDPSTDYSATLYLDRSPMTPAQVQDWVNQRKSDAAALYDARESLHAAIGALT